MISINKFLAFLIFLILAGAIIIVGIVIYNKLSADEARSTEKTQTEEAPGTEEANEVSTKSASLANPASMKCEELGGSLKIEKNGQGSEYGVCEFKTGNACEEWALLREFCPVEGISIKEDISNQQRFCLLAGGEIDEEGNLCKLPDGNSCNIDKYYNGNCE